MAFGKKKKKDSGETVMSDSSGKRPSIPIAASPRQRYNPDDIAYCKIHPGLGIARVGNSPDEFFIGPETPGQLPHPQGGFKDSKGRIKRQAARFRVYGYNAQGEAVAELTAEDADIHWTVQLANKKASYRIFLGRYWDIQYPEVKKYGDEHFGGEPPMRNQQVPVSDPERRSQLLDIKPEAKSITSANESGSKYAMKGTFGPLPYSIVTAGKNQEALAGSRSGYMNVPFIDPTQPQLTQQFQETAKKYNWQPGILQEPVAESGSTEVYLGELRTDKHGRLLVLGGFGESRSLIPDNDVGFLNGDDYFGSNDYWYDDVSDGLVTADVTLKNGKKVETREKSWVIVGPPKFAPFLETLTTLWDQTEQVAQNKGQLPLPEKVSFTHDVYPILLRLNEYQWVNQFALQQHGSGMVFDPMSIGPHTANLFPQMHELPAGDGGTDANRDIRMHVFARLRKPVAVLQAEHPEMSFQELIESQYATEQSGMSKMPQMWGDGGDGLDPVGSVAYISADDLTNPGGGVPGGTYVTWATLTERQYRQMEKWAAGHFEDDWPAGRNPLDAPRAIPTPKLPVKDQPRAIDRASLLPCVGAPFFPGIEITYICEQNDFWAEEGRPQWRTLQPGDVTRHMALPWQADFSECNHRWWPAARPDDIVTEAQYEEVVKYYDPALDGSLQRSLAARSLWSRGISQVSPDLDNDMVSHWHEFGFILPKTVHGDTAYVEEERDPYAGCPERDAFYYLMNIAEHQEFLPHAKKMVEAYLAQARQNARDPNTTNLQQFSGWNYFKYSPEAFDARMQDIYAQYVLSNSDPSYLVNSNYEQVRFGQIQMAPFNQLDGAWIRGAAPPGPVDQVRNYLFHIYMDELGDAIDAHNHANVYTDLMHSLNFYPFPINSWDYAQDPRFLDEAFTEPVFILAISNFTEEYLPEILGMTLYLEWASVGLTSSVNQLEGVGIDAAFYKLHVGIDNASAGHGAIAKKAVELYLDQVRAQGGDEAVQQAFERIWTGYVAFGTLGNLNEAIQNYFTQQSAAFQKESTMQADLLQQMVDMINSKALYARQNHGTKKLGPNFINDWFDDPIGFLDELQASGYVIPGKPQESPMFQLMSFNGPMFHVFTPAEQKLWHDYIVSLVPTAPPPKVDLEKAMLYVVDKLRQRQSGSPGHHARLTGLDPRSGNVVTMPIAWWFSEKFTADQAGNDYVFLGALRNPVNGWIVPGSAGTSPLITQMLSGDGDMAKAFQDYVPKDVVVSSTLDDQTSPPYTFKQVLAMWVNDGCRIHDVVEPSLTTQKQTAAKGQLSIREKGAPSAPAPDIAPPQPAKRERPHRVYGMGMPH